uniref:Tyrosine specific protein phosphatases domain-containing protein n=1 Tax=Labrus bergylta TaxID=56723 RepID=A0A3Q3GMA6_9LABR
MPPDRWLEYSPVGRRIPGTRFIAFKVPLKPNRQNQDLGLIVDLTFSRKYYRLSDVPQSVSYIKIPTQGQRVPSDATILRFKRAVTHFLQENSDNDKLFGVHCTHGLNRTGYLVCRYLIDVDGVDPAAALELFNSIIFLLNKKVYLCRDPTDYLDKNWSRQVEKEFITNHTNNCLSVRTLNTLLT